MKMNTDILYLFLILLFGLTIPFLLGSWSIEGFETSDTTSTDTTSPDTTSTDTTSTDTTSTDTTSTDTTGIETKLLNPNNDLETQTNTDMNVIQNQQIYRLTSRLNNLEENSNRYDNYNHYLEKDLTTKNSDNQNANTISTAQYYGSTGTPVIPQTEKEILATSKMQREADRAKRIQKKQSNNQEVHSTYSPCENSVVNKNNNNINEAKKKNKLSTDYSSVFPQGIKQSNIPTGEEDMYILKSQVIPPVCPVCPAFPSASLVSKKESCQPCPPCGRCPEPAFDCKKVPNYDALNNQVMPVPVLNDFSTFGM